MNVCVSQLGTEETVERLLQEIFRESVVSQHYEQVGPKPRRRSLIDVTERGLVHFIQLAATSRTVASRRWPQR